MPDRAQPQPVQVVARDALGRATADPDQLAGPGHELHAQDVRFQAPRTGVEIDLGAFSRKRKRNSANSGTVLG